MNDNDEKFYQSLFIAAVLLMIAYCLLRLSV